MKGDDVGRIKSATESLMQAYQRVGQAMYAGAQQASAAAGPEAGAESGGPEPSGEGDVVEGEIVDEEGTGS